MAGPVRPGQTEEGRRRRRTTKPTAPTADNAATKPIAELDEPPPELGVGGEVGGDAAPATTMPPPGSAVPFAPSREVDDEDPAPVLEVVAPGGAVVVAPGTVGPGTGPGGPSGPAVADGTTEAAGPGEVGGTTGGVVGGGGVGGSATTACVPWVEGRGPARPWPKRHPSVSPSCTVLVPAPPRAYAPLRKYDQ